MSINKIFSGIKPFYINNLRRDEKKPGIGSAPYACRKEQIMIELLLAIVFVLPAVVGVGGIGMLTWVVACLKLKKKK